MSQGRGNEDHVGEENGAPRAKGERVQRGRVVARGSRRRGRLSHREEIHDASPWMKALRQGQGRGQRFQESRGSQAALLSGISASASSAVLDIPAAIAGAKKAADEQGDDTVHMDDMFRAVTEGMEKICNSLRDREDDNQNGGGGGNGRSGNSMLVS